MRKSVIRVWDNNAVGQSALASKDLKGLFVAHRRELQAYLTERLHDGDVAADLTQETFLRFAEQGGAATIGQPRSYLYRTARNLAIDHVRQKARRRTDSVANDDLAHLADDTANPEEATDARRRLAQLRDIIAELPDRTRQIFVLNRVEGLTYAEIAERLEVSESSVQKHLAKALQHVLLRLQTR